MNHPDDHHPHRTAASRLSPHNGGLCRRHRAYRNRDRGGGHRSHYRGGRFPRRLLSFTYRFGRPAGRLASALALLALLRAPSGPPSLPSLQSLQSPPCRPAGVDVLKLPRHS